MTNKVSDNLNPKLIMVEGSAPANPASGNQSVFIDSADHKFKRINSSGTVVDIEAGGGSSTLAADTDVALASLANFDQLQYQATDSKFHNVKGGMVKVAPDVVLGTSAASISFSSIPSGYRHLMLLYSARATGANTFEALQLRFNSDSGANYNHVAWDTAGAAASTGQTSISLNYIAGGGAAANGAGGGVITIPNYGGTTFYKTANVTGYEGNGLNRSGADAGLWLSTVAITGLTFLLGANSFDAGTTFSLYGVV